MLGYSNQFARLAYFRDAPDTFEYEAATDFLCSLGATYCFGDTFPTPMSVEKCALYLKSGNRGCKLCLRKLHLNWDYIAAALRRGELDTNRAPILELFLAYLQGKPVEFAFETRQAQRQSHFQTKRKRRQSGKIIEEASTSLQVAHMSEPEPEIPDPKKYLYRGTCGECGTKRAKIVAWDMCHVCHYKWKKGLL